MSIEQRICSLETEYALVCTNRVAKPAEREHLVGLLEDAVLAEHGAVPCNSFGRRNTVRLANGSEIRLREGYFVDNGSRFYYDAGHIEWANPEATSPRTATVYEKAAERNLEEALVSVNVARTTDSAPPSLMLVKNNIDYSGDVSYGCHENYSLRRHSAAGQDTFTRLVDDLVPFLVTRQLFCGAGRLGARRAKSDDAVAFQLSQRADFMETIESLNAREVRGILNQRDEPLADPYRWRRLHLILGDSNLSEFATFLKLGTTSIVLNLIEANLVGGRWALRAPLDALWRVSRDWHSAQLVLRRGDKIAALDIQREYWLLARQLTADVSPQHWSHRVLDSWDKVLQDLARGETHLADRLDWASKRHYLFDPLLTATGVSWQELGGWEYVFAQTRHLPLPPPEDGDPRGWVRGYLGPEAFRSLDQHVTRHRLDWRLYPERRRLLAKLREIDFRYHDISSQTGVRGWIQSAPDPACTFDDIEIRMAMHHPPNDTRAWQRGQIIVQANAMKFPVQMDWDKVLLGESGRLIDMADPFIVQSIDLQQLAGKIGPPKPDSDSQSNAIRIKIIGVEHIARD